MRSPGGPHYRTRRGLFRISCRHWLDQVSEGVRSGAVIDMVRGRERDP